MCKAKSRKWKTAAFYFILDTARVNAQTMLSTKERKDVRKTKSFDIGFDLAMSLVVPEIKRRPKIGLNKTVLRKMAAILNDDEDESNNDNVNSFPKLGEKTSKLLHMFRYYQWY